MGLFIKNTGSLAGGGGLPGITDGGAWLCTHLWEHYQYTSISAYLREVYPLIGAVFVFFIDFLVPHPNGKWLVTNPSTTGKFSGMVWRQQTLFR